MNRGPAIPPSRQKDATAEKSREQIEIWQGNRGNKLDRVVTHRDLVRYRLGSISQGGQFQVVDDPAEPETYVGPLTNLTADGGFGIIFLNWEGTSQSGYGYTEIWRSSDDNLSNAVLNATTQAGLYADPVNDGAGYYYWVRGVSTTGNPGAFNATAGTYGESALAPEYIIDQIQGLISKSELAAEVLTPVNAIPSIQTTLDDHGIRIPSLETTVGNHAIQIPSMQDLLDDYGPRIDAAEGTIVSHETDITNLQASVTSAELDIVANADAFTSLDTRVTVNETEISTQAGQITSLQSSLNDLTIPAFDAGKAYSIGELFRESNVVYEVIATQSQPNATPPNTTYYDPRPDYETIADTVSANSAAVSALDTRVTSAEGTITAQGTDITLLQSDLNSAEGDIAANASATSSLGTRVTSAEGDITSLSGDITTLQGSLTTTNGNVTTNANAITSLQTEVSNIDGVITSQSTDITQLQNDLDAAELNVTANAGAITSLDTRVTATEGDISSQSTQLTSLSNSLTAAQGDITANSDALTLLDSRVVTAEGTITANSSDITQLQADVQALDVDGNAQALQDLDVRVTANETDITAIASDVTTLTASVNGNTSAIQTKAEVSAVQAVEDDITVLSAEYTIKLDVNDYMSGIGFANDGSSSSMVIASDAVYFIDPGQSIAPFNPGTNYSSMQALRDTQFVFGYATVEGSPRFVINVPAYIPEAYITGLQVKLATITGANIVNASIGGAKIDIAQIWDLSISDRIRSTNYSAGSTGFIINRSGNAEFNNVTVRGHVEADTGYISQNLQIGGTSRNFGELVQLAEDADTSLFENWIRPNTTLIDGNKIFTGDAYVDTLQIKGNAVTFPKSARRASELYLFGGWQTLCAFSYDSGVNFDIDGILSVGVSGTPQFQDDHLDFRVVRGGSVLFTKTMFVRSPRHETEFLKITIPAGTATYSLQVSGSSNTSARGSFMLLGAKR